jgi:hypothetical protein
MLSNAINVASFCDSFYGIITFVFDADKPVPRINSSLIKKEPRFQPWLFGSTDCLLKRSLSADR